MENLRNLIYTVRPGDTFWKIASLHQVSVRDLIIANPLISNPNILYIGQQVNIPTKPVNFEIEKEIIRLVNIERSTMGIGLLGEDFQISKVARIKSQDMIDNNYFSHTSPKYGSPFSMLSSFGISFSQAAENIAYGQQTAQNVMNSWMNSSGHKANILNPNFNKIGVGVAKKGTQGPYYFTQLFIKS